MHTHSAPDSTTAVAAPSRPSPRRVLAVLLVTWVAANGLTHAIVGAATGGTYYQLPLFGLLGAEASISVLNVLLPIVAVRCILREPGSFAASFGWQWTGWRIPALAVCGFIGFMLLSMTSNRVFADETSSSASSTMCRLPDGRTAPFSSMAARSSSDWSGTTRDRRGLPGSST